MERQAAALSAAPPCENLQNFDSFRDESSMLPGMTASFPRTVPASDHSVLVEFGDSIGLDVHTRVHRFFITMQRHADPCVRNLHPAYTSVLVCFDPDVISQAGMTDLIQARLQRLDTIALPPPRVVEVPVCYAPEFGPDLELVAKSHGVTGADAIRAHTAPEYQVYFLGFSPGFPYLHGLAPQLATPRRTSPRARVAAGSVAIGGAVTGIYPVASPGGWNLIGRTPLRLFAADRSPQMQLEIGDCVRFHAITRHEFDASERLA